METTIELFRPHKGQKEILKGFADTDHKFGIVSTGRQFGKSLLASNLMCYWLLNNPNSKGAWITPVYSQGRKVFLELVKALGPILESTNKSELSITLGNGSSLIFLSSERPDSIRGYSFTHMVVDEAAFVRKEGFYESILPTLTATGKKCLIISTPKGKGNWLYEWYVRGLDGSKDYISFEGISEDNPYVDSSFIEEQRKSLPLEMFQQEYQAKFVDGGNDVFTNLETTCTLNEWPEYRPSEKYYFGIDTGLSQDYSVLSIISESGRLHKMVRINGETIRDLAQRFIVELQSYGNISGYVETNGIGRAMFEEIRRGIRTTTGFNTSNETKVAGIRGLIQDMQNGILELPSKNLFPELYRELAAFTYKTSTTGKTQFSHPPGMHDDTVMSLMMANQARNQLKIKATSKIYVGQFR